MVTVSLSDIDPDAASLALEPLNGPVVTAPKIPKLTGNTADALAALRTAIENHGEQVASNYIPSNVRCVNEETWRTYFYQETTADQEAKKKAFQRAKQTLKERTRAAHHGALWWIVTQGKE
jgi:hypothetical protein